MAEAATSPLYDFFLAHAGGDGKVAERLFDLLEQGGGRAFLASRSLLLGDDWDLALARAQRSSRISVIMVSSRTPGAFYQREEIAAALAYARLHHESHRVIPLYLEPIAAGADQPPYGLHVKHGIELGEDTPLEVVAGRLLDLLARLDGRIKGAEPAAAEATPISPPAVAPLSGPEPASPLATEVAGPCCRETELAEIGRCIRAVAGGSPVRCEQMILISGESGVGKSALATAAIEIAQRSGFHVISVVCEPFHEGMSFFPVRETMRQLTAEIAVPERLARFYGPNSTQAAIAALAEDPAADPVERRDALIATFVNLLFGRFSSAAASHESRPVLVFLDDLERIDAGSADALLCLLSRLREGPVLLLGAYRSDLVESTLSGSHPLKLLLAAVRRAVDRARVLRLQPLPRTALAAMTESILGGHCALPPRFYDRLYKETEGNPLFVREILRSLTRMDPASPIVRVEGVWRAVRETEDWQTPETVEDAIRARLDLLEAPLRANLEIAAVIGRRFAFSVIARLSENSESDLLDQLESLLDLELLRETAGAEETFEFAHGKIRDVLYQSMSKLRRRRVHGEIAEALKVFPAVGIEDREALTGEHLFQGGRYGDALPLLLRAARNAMHLQASTEAIGCFRKAMEAGAKAGFPPGESAIGLKIEMAEALKLANDYDQARELCLEIIRETQDDLKPRGWAFNFLGDIYATRGKVDAALEAYGQSEQLARRAGDDELLLETTADLCELHDRESERLAGIDVKAVEHHRGAASRYLDEQLRLAEASGTPPAKSRAWRNRAKRERAEGRLDLALLSYEQAIAISDPRVATHSVLISYAKTLRWVARLAEARAVVDRVMEWSSQTGARRSMAIAHQYRALLEMEQSGAPTPAARKDLEVALEVHTEVGFARGERETTILLGEWFLRSGKADQASFYFRRAAGGSEASEEEVMRIICEQLRAAGEVARATALAGNWRSFVGDGGEMSP